MQQSKEHGHERWWRWMAAGLALAAACGAQRASPQQSPERPAVTKLEIGVANVYVVQGARTVLVDTGTNAAFEDLTRQLNAMGVKPGDLSLAILTSCRGDHAGNAKRLRQAYRVPIALGAGDLAMCAEGKDDLREPTSTFGRLLDRFEPRYPALKPDLTIEERLDLRAYGVVGEAVALPGHTEGSLAVVLADGDAFLGDAFAGDVVPNRRRTSRPASHFEHVDRERAEQNLCALLRRGVKRLYLGHGEPVSAASAQQRFCAAPKP